MRLLATRITSIASAAKRLFSPISLFSVGEQGAWYDPSDWSTLFQDSIGLLPVTAVGQPVGLMLDKSGRGNHAMQVTAINRPILGQDANGKYYLAFNGTNSWMSTSAIDFTATDKITVFAGIRKLSDTGTGTLVESSSSLSVNDGSFVIFAPDTGLNYEIGLRGNATSLYKLSTPSPAPRTDVLSVSLDISQTSAASEITTRLGGEARALTPVVAGPSGVGNFGNYQLYLGARAGPSLLFNGQLYGLIIRGSLSLDLQLISSEKWLANKTGVTL